jgi:hypothetical protein
MKRTQVTKPLRLQRKDIKVLQPAQLEHVVGGHGWCGGGGGENNWECSASKLCGGY